MELGIISGGDLETSVWILHHDANPCPSPTVTAINGLGISYDGHDVV